MSRWIVLGLWLSVAIGVMPSAASAGPKPLTPAQMDKVTAGLPSLISQPLILQRNLSLAVQVAIPVAIANSVCSICSNASASAVAIATNFNLANQVNLIGR
jgi:hypothetical protein